MIQFTRDSLDSNQKTVQQPGDPILNLISLCPLEVLWFWTVTIRCLCNLRVPVPSSPGMWVVFGLSSSSPVLKEILIRGKALLSSRMKWMESAFSLPGYGCVLPNVRTRRLAHTCAGKAQVKGSQCHSQNSLVAFKVAWKEKTTA